MEQAHLEYVWKELIEDVREPRAVNLFMWKNIFKKVMSRVKLTLGVHPRVKTERNGILKNT